MLDAKQGTPSMAAFIEATQPTFIKPVGVTHVGELASQTIVPERSHGQGTRWSHPFSRWLHPNFQLGLIVITLLFALSLAYSPKVGAHVAAAVKDNNRYLKITVFDRAIRLVSIIYFGEIPGQRARRAMDTDNNGTLSDDEVAVFVESWSTRVHDALEIDVMPTSEIDWEPPSPGIDDRSSNAGAFSIDIVGWVCIDSLRSTQTLTLRDTLTLPTPGEIEIRPEESPGTEITSLKLDGQSMTSFNLVGEQARKLARGFEIQWITNEQQSVPNPHCQKPTDSSKPQRRGLLGGVLAAVIAAIIFLAWITRRQQATS